MNIYQIFKTLEEPREDTVILTLVDDTPNVEVSHGWWNDLSYKNKEALNTDDEDNAILDIGQIFQSHGVNGIFISSLICRKNKFKNNKGTIINKLLRSACDSLGFNFLGNSSNHLASDGYI